MSTKLRKVQAQRKFAQGAFIPPNINNNNIERRSEATDKPAPPPAIIQNMSATELLDRISFNNIHTHETRKMPIVRLERLPGMQQEPPPVQPERPLSTWSFLSESISSFKMAMPLIYRLLPKGQKKTKTLKKRVPIKKTSKMIKKKRIARVIRPQRKTTKRKRRCCTEDTDTEDDTPLKYLVKSNKKHKTAPQTVNHSPRAALSRNNKNPAKQGQGSASSPDCASFYSADNIERWISAAVESSNQFKVPLPPRDKRKTNACKSKVTPNDKADGLPGKTQGQSAKLAKLDNSNVPVEDYVHRQSSEVNMPGTSTQVEGSVTGSDRSLLDRAQTPQERPASTCPSERYVTVRDVVRASSEERRARCKTCSFCSRASKVEKLSQVVQATADGRAPDVYEFDIEREGNDPSLRGFRSRRRPANEEPIATDSNYVYLDILPNSSKHVIQIKLTPDINKKKPMMQARLMPKNAATSLNEYNLVEHENLFEKLIETLDSKLLKRLNMAKSPDKNAAVAGTSKTVKNKDVDNHSAGTSKTLGNSKSSPQSSVKHNKSDESSNEAPTVTRKRRGRPNKLKMAPKPVRRGVTKRRQIRATNGRKHAAKNGAVLSPTRSLATAAASSGLADGAGADESGPNADKSKSNAVVRNAPVYYPTEEEFSDPVAYFEKIMPTASKFGLCKVVAPASFKPKCTVNDKIRFNVSNQYIARLYTRWGPACKEMCAIKAYLATQGVPFIRAPILDSLEVDLPKLYRTVQRLGGLNTVIEKKLWCRVAEQMRFAKGPKLVKKLDDIYVKYLLPYDTLSSQEREDIRAVVSKRWHKKNEKILQRMANPLVREQQLLGESGSSTSDTEEDNHVAYALTEAEDCIVTGPRMTLANFARVAQAVKDQYFPDTPDPTPREVEDEYWRIVLLAAEHICVNTASIDTGEEGYGFPKNKQDPYGRHPWNPKVISQNPGNVLTMLGPLLGVTVPTLHLGMIFSTSCWHRDPHGLPWMEYMHSGPAKIWYGIPDDQSAAFRTAVERLCPTSCQNKSIWLPSDITMIPPNFLLSSNVSLTRVEQKPGEYIIVFPKAYSSSISTGYTQSESVYFATNSWLKSVDNVFHELRDSCEPTMFSLEQLLISVAGDPRAPPSLLQLVHTTLTTIVDDELQNRRDLMLLGVATTASTPRKKPAAAWNDECEVCRATLYLSKVIGVLDRKSSVCLKHALRLLTPKKNKPDVAGLQLVEFFTKRQLEDVMAKLQSGICPQ